VQTTGSVNTAYIGGFRRQSRAKKEPVSRRARVSGQAYRFRASCFGQRIPVKDFIHPPYAVGDPLPKATLLLDIYNGTW
jgi:hypothetical protein